MISVKIVEGIKHLFTQFDMIGQSTYPESMKRILLWSSLLSVLFVTPVYAQDDESGAEETYDEIVARLQDTAATDAVPLFSGGLSTRSFQNNSLSLSGEILGVDLSLHQPGEWMIGLELPFLNGTSYGRASQELGNMKLYGRFARIGFHNNMDLWFPMWARLGQRGSSYIIASRHDTYRIAPEFEYREGRLLSRLSAGYQFRILEQDPRVNVGDIIESNFLIRLSLTNLISLETALEWYRVQALQIDKKKITADGEWGGFSPGLIMHLTRGLDLFGSVTLPIHQQGSNEDLELAFNEIYYPQPGVITWKWGLGAYF